MESFPPPQPADIVHQPDDAPFLQPPGNGGSRKWLWLVLALVGLAAVVLGVVLFADQVGDGTHPEASSQSSTAEASVTSVASESMAATESSADATVTTEEDEPTTAAPEPSTTSPPTTAPATTQTETPTTVAAASPTTVTETSAATTVVVPPTTVPVAPIPGWDLSGLEVRAVIVSPGKSNGRPSQGAVPVGFGVVPMFPASTEYVCIFWNTNGMPSDVPNGIIWTRDGQVVRSLEQTSFEWDKGSRERPNWCVPSQPIGLDTGFHRVEYYVAGVQQWVAEFIIGG